MAAPGALDVEQRAALGGTGDLASWGAVADVRRMMPTLTLVR